MKKDKPKIEWDNPNSDGFGGFRVVKNLENFIAPGDWVVDPDDPSHFVPRYLPCKYRRLSQGTKASQGRPCVKIHCLLFEEVVDMDTCVDCSDRVDPPEYTQIDIRQPPDKKHGVKILPDIVFGADQPGSKYVRKPAREQLSRQPSRQQTPWEPCMFREQIPHEECGSCVKYRCACEGCPLIGKTLRKKDCQECQHRKEN